MTNIYSSLSLNGISPSSYIVYSAHDSESIFWREKDGTYRCVAAGCDREKDGQILYYSSNNGINWKYESVLAKNHGRFGKIWECPDFFELDGKYVLLVSPMEMEAQGYEYRNGGGNLCLTGTFDNEKNDLLRSMIRRMIMVLIFMHPRHCWPRTDVE